MLKIKFKFTNLYRSSIIELKTITEDFEKGSVKKKCDYNHTLYLL